MCGKLSSALKAFIAPSGMSFRPKSMVMTLWRSSTAPRIYSTRTPSCWSLGSQLLSPNGLRHVFEASVKVPTLYKTQTATTL